MNRLKNFIIYCKKCFEINRFKISLKSYPLVHVLLSLIANFFLPFFIKLKIHQNYITFINLILTIVFIFIILDNNRYSYYCLFFYSIYHLIDHIDGGMARWTKTKTFFGKLLDSYTDAFFNVFFKLAIFTYCYYILLDINLYILNIFSIAVIAFDVFLLDKFAAITRWCNEQNNTKIEPYIRKKKLSFVNFILEDIVFILMISIPFLINKLAVLEKILIFLSFLFWISAIFNIVSHFKFAKKNLFKKKL